MSMDSNKFQFPLVANYVKNKLEELEIDLRSVSIRELNRLVDDLSNYFNVEFLRFEFGIPGLKPNAIGINEEIRILEYESHSIGKYPPFDGIVRLKNATANFIKKFLNVDVGPDCCIPTVGAMHGGFICQSIAGRIRKESSKILYLDPGFPVNKLQTKFLGLQSSSIDLYDHRGDKLLESIEKQLSSGEVGGLLWSSPNNPAWVCLKEEELEGIGKLLTKYDVLGIEDAAYFGMDFRKDYGCPDSPPFVPSIANYTENYFLIISSSKIFSYAGQRIAMTVMSPSLMEKRYENLYHFFDTKRVGHAFVHGGIYPTTAGVSRTAQNALAALFESANSGDYAFLNEVKVYAERAKVIKEIFLSNDFQLVYDYDMGEPIGDGFYFTVSKHDMSGDDLLFLMLCHGMAGISLNTTGSKKEGIRICVSLIRDDQINKLRDRLTQLNSSVETDR